MRLSSDVYATKTHDSLKISNGLWHQWSTGIGGRSALDYLIKIRGMSLPDAVLAIDSGTVFTPSFSYARKPKRPTELQLPERSDTNDRIIQYLTGRGIDRTIVQELIDAGRIYEEREHHNVVFVGIDSAQQPRHAALRASSEKRFMLDAQGSDKRYSFSLEGAAGNTELHVFESAIDLLSYCTLEKMSGVDWRKSHKLSLSGVSLEKNGSLPMALEHYLHAHPCITHVFLHLDNDPPGRKAAGAICSAMPQKMTCIDRPPPCGKDCNDYLIEKIKSKNRSDAR